MRFVSDIKRECDESLERSRARRQAARERRPYTAISLAVIAVIIVAFAIFLIIFPR